ncbi:hypothetical protein AB0F73_10050 [Micromonospora purpureochromogenes]|uniref:hypothetical protein n=1 Tax=Micromonospora purpureochromogenes TaxID=47872 RepID=UPI00340AF4FF
MTLGPDKTICATELREAMRSQLDTLNPPLGSNVDDPRVKPNFDALGDGVWRILTVDAETISSAAQDPMFWAFITNLRTEIEQLRAFDAGLKTAFAAWDPTLPASGTALKTALAALAVPGSTPAAPTRLDGRVR